jgi:short-subunit dehydrogenase
MQIAGKRVVITGASSGIGLELARLVARRGGALLLAARRLERLQTLAAEIREECPETPMPRVVHCDVSDRACVRRLVDTAVRRLGGIDILINNAGISVFGDAEGTSPEDVCALMQVNFFGPLYGMLDALPEMKRGGGGLIVNVISVAAIHGVPYLAAYGASKAALASFGQSLRAELAETDISVINVYPSYTRTNIFAVEKKTGGARRPKHGYVPASRVARAVARAIETEKREVVLSAEGKALSVLRGLFPTLVQRAMERMAAGLREKGQATHG